MAKDVERLVLELSADVSRLDRGMKQGQAIIQRQTRAIERQFDQMNKRTVGSVTAMSSGINSAIGGIALGLAAREVQQYADAWTRASNSIKAAGSTNEEASQQLDMLVGIALRSRSSLEGTITLYNRLTAASDSMGVSQERVARVVETANKALATSNLTTGERTSALTQLAQGLGSGTLAGDELKAIRENSIVLAQAIADEFNTTIGGLKELGSEGELTSARVFRALEKASAGVDASFARTRATISDAFTNLETKTIQFVGRLDATTGASAKLAAVIEFVANNLDGIATAATVAGVAVGTYYAGAMTAAAARTVAATVAALAYQLALVRMAAAQKGVTSAQILLNAALTANPIGLAIVAVAALAAGLVYLNSQYSRGAIAARQLAETSEKAADWTSRYQRAQMDAANSTGEATKKLWEKVEALKAEGAELIRNARLAAQNAINDAVVLQRRAREAEQLAGAARTNAASGTGNPYAPGFDSGMAEGRARRLRAEHKAAKDVADDYLSTLTQLEEIRSAPAPSTSVIASPTEDKAGGRRSRGPTAEEIRRMREELALQGQLDVARARGDEAEQRRVQRLLDILSLTDQLTRAQVSGAEAVATAHIDEIMAAEDIEKQIDGLIKQSERRTQQRIDAEQALTAEQERQLETELAIARLAGDSVLIRALERELDLRRQIASLGPNATPEQRQAVVSDQRRINRAEDDAREMDRYREGAREFVDILRADDIWAEAGSRFRQAAWDNLEDVLANVAKAIFSQQGGGGSNPWMQAAASFFGGNRALGGPVKAGKAYRVNENTPNSEFFVPKSDGWVGNIKQPRAGRGGQSVSVRQGDITIIGRSDAQLMSDVQRVVAASQRQTIAIVKSGAPAAQLEESLLRN